MEQSLADLLHFLRPQLGLEMRLCAQEYGNGHLFRVLLRPPSQAQPLDTCQTVNGCPWRVQQHMPGELWQFLREDAFAIHLVKADSKILSDYFFPKHKSSF